MSLDGVEKSVRMLQRRGCLAVRAMPDLGGGNRKSSAANRRQSVRSYNQTIGGRRAERTALSICWSTQRLQPPVGSFHVTDFVRSIGQLLCFFVFSFLLSRLLQHVTAVAIKPTSLLHSTQNDRASHLSLLLLLVAPIDAAASVALTLCSYRNHTHRYVRRFRQSLSSLAVSSTSSPSPSHSLCLSVCECMGYLTFAASLCGFAHLASS